MARQTSRPATVTGDRHVRIEEIQEREERPIAVRPLPVEKRGTDFRCQPSGVGALVEIAWIDIQAGTPQSRHDVAEAAAADNSAKQRCVRDP